MTALESLLHLMIFPGGLCLLLVGLLYTWINHKLLARFHNRLGPRWFQPIADAVKLLAKADIIAGNAPRALFLALPVLALAGALTAGLYVPLIGFKAAGSFNGDVIVVLYLLSLLSLTTGLIGLVMSSPFTAIGSSRVMTQLFAYEVPFFVAMLGPAFAAGSWQIESVVGWHGGAWLLLTQPIGFVVALVSLMGKVEMPPFDAPEAETEIVAGSLTEYTGRGLAVFKLARSTVLVVGLTFIAAVYLGGVVNPVDFLLKTGGLLALMTALQALLTRFRIDQTVTLWWRYGVMLVFVQWLVLIVVEVA